MAGAAWVRLDTGYFSNPPEGPMILWMAGKDWDSRNFPDMTQDDWDALHGELGVSDRYTFRMELVDEGRVRLHTLRKTTFHAKPPAVQADWDNGPCWRCADMGLICTAVYVDIRKLPAWLLERMHP